jgi:hypothetical protein
LFVRYLQVTGFSDALQRVTEAIEVLRRGDLDCVVGATNLSKRLGIFGGFENVYPEVQGLDTLLSVSWGLGGFMNLSHDFEGYLPGR